MWPTCRRGIPLALSLGMTMVRWTRTRCAALSETLRELANLFAAGPVIGQLVGERRLSWVTISGGTLVWFAFVADGLWLEGER